MKLKDLQVLLILLHVEYSKAVWTYIGDGADREIIQRYPDFKNNGLVQNIRKSFGLGENDQIDPVNVETFGEQSYVLLYEFKESGDLRHIFIRCEYNNEHMFILHYKPTRLQLQQANLSELERNKKLCTNLSNVGYVTKQLARSNADLYIQAWEDLPVDRVAHLTKLASAFIDSTGKIGLTIAKATSALLSKHLYILCTVVGEDKQVKLTLLRLDNYHTPDEKMEAKLNDTFKYVLQEYNEKGPIPPVQDLTDLALPLIISNEAQVAWINIGDGAQANVVKSYPNFKDKILVQNIRECLGLKKEDKIMEPTCVQALEDSYVVMYDFNESVHLRSIFIRCEYDSLKETFKLSYIPTRFDILKANLSELKEIKTSKNMSRLGYISQELTKGCADMYMKTWIDLPESDMKDLINLASAFINAGKDLGISIIKVTSAYAFPKHLYILCNVVNEKEITLLRMDNFHILEDKRKAKLNDTFKELVINFKDTSSIPSTNEMTDMALEIIISNETQSWIDGEDIDVNIQRNDIFGPLITQTVEKANLTKEDIVAVQFNISNPAKSLFLLLGLLDVGLSLGTGNLKYYLTHFNENENGEFEMDYRPIRVDGSDLSKISELVNGWFSNSTRRPTTEEKHEPVSNPSSSSKPPANTRNSGIQALQLTLLDYASTIGKLKSGNNSFQEKKKEKLASGAQNCWYDLDKLDAVDISRKGIIEDLLTQIHNSKIEDKTAGKFKANIKFNVVSVPNSIFILRQITNQEFQLANFYADERGNYMVSSVKSIKTSKEQEALRTANDLITSSRFLEMILRPAVSKLETIAISANEKAYTEKNLRPIFSSHYSKSTMALVPHKLVKYRTMPDTIFMQFLAKDEATGPGVNTAVQIGLMVVSFQHDGTIDFENIHIPSKQEIDNEELASFVPLLLKKSEQLGTNSRNAGGNFWFTRFNALTKVSNKSSSSKSSTPVATKMESPASNTPTVGYLSIDIANFALDKYARALVAAQENERNFAGNIDNTNTGVANRETAATGITIPIHPLTRNPTAAWFDLKLKHFSKKLDIGSFTKYEAYDRATHVRFLCISDTHDTVDEKWYENLPPADVLIHAGDFTHRGELAELEKFKKFFEIIKDKYEHKILIAGNHDKSFDDKYKYKKNAKDPKDKDQACEYIKGWKYLKDEPWDVEGYKVYGSPWSSEYGDWAFGAKRGPESAKNWSKIPSDTDILITHGPQLGHGDLNVYNERVGCAELARAIEMKMKVMTETYGLTIANMTLEEKARLIVGSKNHAPLIHLFGHNHEGYGASTNGFTTCINASTITYSYKPTNPPIVFDLPRRLAIGPNSSSQQIPVA